MDQPRDVGPDPFAYCAGACHVSVVPTPARLVTQESGMDAAAAQGHPRCMAADSSTPRLTPTPPESAMSSATDHITRPEQLNAAIAEAFSTGDLDAFIALRSEERRVGKECRSRW